MQDAQFKITEVKASKHGNTHQAYRVVAPTSKSYYDRKSMSISREEYHELQKLDKDSTNVVVQFINPDTEKIDDKPFFHGKLRTFLQKEVNITGEYVIFWLYKPAES
jgi:hypothetical protein